MKPCGPHPACCADIVDFSPSLRSILLATPLVVGLVKPDSAASILKEGRNPAPPPNAPDSPRDWLTLPKEIDAYLKDRFGLREKMIRLHKDLTKPLCSGRATA